MNTHTVDKDRWQSMTILEQMGNIGSEVGRALKAKRAGEDFEPALRRALDLFDATLEPLIAKKSPRAKEVLRSKDQFLRALYEKDDSGIENYFMQYAIAARLHR